MIVRDMEDIKHAVITHEQKILALEGRVGSVERRQERYEEAVAQQNRDAKNNLILSILTLVSVLLSILISLTR